jgi:lipopolysaccharide transport system ATP-binding protein
LNVTYTAISVQGVGKVFPLWRQRSPSARQMLNDLVHSPFRRGAERVGGEADGFWALQDIGFDVASGEVLGVVGHNGAGKSVLLKLLSRVMRPTRGRLEIRGSVAPLLEMGTGFQPDLTGRENVYLNGVILGMRYNEVHARIDEIVDFAGIGAFLDLPVKQYSSGMHVRLAFAVAVHLNRDIFLLDEVLTVGDRPFQEKCLARLRQLARDGRTILLVSHGDYLLESLCSRAILLDHGRLLAAGTPSEINARYTSLGAGGAS